MEERFACEAHGHLVAGVWRQPTSETMAVVNPATEAVVALTPLASRDLVDEAAHAAAQAFQSWSWSSVDERSELLTAIADGIAGRREELAETITAEVGVPVRSSGPVQVDLAERIFRQYATLVSEHTFEEMLDSSLIVHEPIGVVGAITPWNYPLYQIAAKVAAALAAGCSVVLKPSEVAPINAVIFGEIVADAGTPDGLINIVFGTGAPVGEWLASHGSVDMVSFTGSTRAGRRVSELAAQTVKPVALELGGKSACVVVDGADLYAAVRDTVAKCYANSGQNCGALSRLIVPASLEADAVDIATAFAAEFRTGDPLDPETRLGPLVNPAQRERVLGLVESGKSEGASLVFEETSSFDRGYFVGPHVFSGVTQDMRLANEEVFGPVLSIMKSEDVESAVRLANSTPYGLCAAVWSPDADQALAIARRLRAGQIDINGAPYNALAPFGGFGASGHGRELGPFGLTEFLTPKSFQLGTS